MLSQQKCLVVMSVIVYILLYINKILRRIFRFDVLLCFVNIRFSVIYDDILC